jgi:hypothetical protein
MDYRKFLGKEERMVFPYMGGSSIEGHGRLLRVKERPAARGWYLFRVVGRNAWPVEATSAPDEATAPLERGHHYGGYLFTEGGRADEIELSEGEPEVFAPCKAYRWSGNDLIFAGTEFESEAEGQARTALDELRPLRDVRGVPATLRQAYGFALLHRRARQLGTHVAPLEVRGRLAAVAEMGLPQANVEIQRLMQERALRAPPARPAAVVAVATPVVTTPVVVPAPPPLTDAQRERQERRLRAADERVHDANVRTLAQSARPANQVRPTVQNAAERAEDALEAAGARMSSARLLDQQRLQVRYRFMNQSFITIVHPLTLQVLDAGICLAGADRMVTIDSLPSVIREAIDTHRLVITRRD